MTKLPKGAITIDDCIIIDYLLKDKTFLDSIEQDSGKLSKIYADFKKNELVCEFVSGKLYKMNLQKVLNKIKEIGYMKDFVN